MNRGRDNRMPFFQTSTGGNADGRGFRHAPAPDKKGNSLSEECMQIAG